MLNERMLYKVTFRGYVITVAWNLGRGVWEIGGQEFNDADLDEIGVCLF